ncbi:MAG TPA: hypothetical protein VFS00_13135 [Polyangiaceae bacterium]|nr:hypothetical protein [Polyangiaceae bacterium]
MPRPSREPKRPAARAGRRGEAPSGARPESAPESGRPGARPAKAPGGDEAPALARRKIERVQTGVRLERRILGVLKALADLHGLSLGDLLEGIVLHAFEGKAPFGGPSLEKIAALREAFGLDLSAEDSHLLVERRPGAGAKGGGA